MHTGAHRGVLTAGKLERTINYSDRFGFFVWKIVFPLLGNFDAKMAINSNRFDSIRTD